MLSAEPTTGVVKGRLPDFIVIGAAKAGTSSLDLYLGLHPEIYMARPKEPRFFVDAPPPTGHWSMGTDWYTRRFVTDKPLCGEASPQYTRMPSLPGVAERMAAVVPNAKLIYLVREPMARLRSQYAMQMKHDTFRGSFADYVDRCPQAVDSSCYGRQLEAYLRHYPLDWILVVESADLQARRRDTLRRIFRFIGADDTFFTPLFLHERNVGRAERYPGPLGRRIERSGPMRLAKRLLHGGAYFYLRNAVLAPFALPVPPPVLPDPKRLELETLLRNEVALLRTLTGLPLPSLDMAETGARR